MRCTWKRPLASTLLLASVVGVLTTGCVVAAGDDDGWRRDRGRWHDSRDGYRYGDYYWRDGRWERYPYRR
jgi:hypothetical protein